MSIVIEEVVSEIIPPTTVAMKESASEAELSEQENDQKKLLRLLKRYERRKHRLLAD